MGRFFTRKRLRGVFWPALPELIPVFAGVHQSFDVHCREAAAAEYIAAMYPRYTSVILSAADCEFRLWKSALLAGWCPPMSLQQQDHYPNDVARHAQTHAVSAMRRLSGAHAEPHTFARPAGASPCW